MNEELESEPVTAYSLWMRLFINSSIEKVRKEWKFTRNNETRKFMNEND